MKVVNVISLKYYDNHRPNYGTHDTDHSNEDDMDINNDKNWRKDAENDNDDYDAVNDNDNDDR